MRRIKWKLVVLSTEKCEDEKLPDTLREECLSLKHQIALYHDNLKIMNKVFRKLNVDLDESNATIEAKENELEDQKAN